MFVCDNINVKHSSIIGDLLLNSTDNIDYNSYLDKLLESVNFANVIDGNGLTVNDKIETLYHKHDIKTSLEVFNSQFTEYIKLKYIFCKLLYKHFEIKYLTQEYNEKFFINLVHSKYRNFITIFTAFDGFNKYFIHTLK